MGLECHNFIQAVEAEEEPPKDEDMVEMPVKTMLSLCENYNFMLGKILNDENRIIVPGS